MLCGSNAAFSPVQTPGYSFAQAAAVLVGLLLAPSRQPPGRRRLGVDAEDADYLERAQMDERVNGGSINRHLNTVWSAAWS